MTKYYTYWSILDTPSNSIKSYSIFLILTGLCVLVWVYLKLLKSKSADNSLILWATGILAPLFLSATIYLKYFYVDNTKTRLEIFLKSSQIKVIEGVVHDFYRKKERHKYGINTTEYFMIDTLEFSYGDVLLGRFNHFGNTYNKFIFNGAKLRITYRNDTSNEILKIEIPQN